MTYEKMSLIVSKYLFGQQYQKKKYNASKHITTNMTDMLIFYYKFRDNASITIAANNFTNT